MEETLTVKFPRGIKTLHIPFLAGFGAYDDLRYKISRIKYPKSAKRIEASMTVSIDLKGDMDYELAQVTVFK